MHHFWVESITVFKFLVVLVHIQTPAELTAFLSYPAAANTQLRRWYTCSILAC